MQQLEPKKIIREHELYEYVGLRRTQIDALVQQGDFPKPIKFSVRRKGWYASDIAAWQKNREQKTQEDRERKGKSKDLAGRQPAMLKPSLAGAVCRQVIPPQPKPKTNEVQGKTERRASVVQGIDSAIRSRRGGSRP